MIKWGHYGCVSEFTKGPSTIFDTLSHYKNGRPAATVDMWMRNIYAIYVMLYRCQIRTQDVFFNEVTELKACRPQQIIHSDVFQSHGSIVHSRYRGTKRCYIKIMEVISPYSLVEPLHIKGTQMHVHSKHQKLNHMRVPDLTCWPKLLSPCKLLLKLKDFLLITRKSEIWIRDFIISRYAYI